jgi:hypothetical protein
LGFSQNLFEKLILRALRARKINFSNYFSNSLLEDVLGRGEEDSHQPNSPPDAVDKSLYPKQDLS